MALWLAARPINADQTIVDAVDAGWWDESGMHDAANGTTLAGSYRSTQYRDFFVFELYGVTQRVTAATFRVYNGYLGGPDSMETYTLFHVSTPVTTLRASGVDQTSIFTDLGSGIAYGSRDFRPADDLTLVDLPLNAAAITALNQSLARQFALGGAVISLGHFGDGVDEFVSPGGRDSLTELVLDVLVHCGNGVTDPGEECDDGNSDPADGCTNFCTVCGNGMVTAPEGCDDSNLINGDGCDADCAVPPLPPTPTPTITLTPAPSNTPTGSHRPTVTPTPTTRTQSSTPTGSPMPSDCVTALQPDYQNCCAGQDCRVNFCYGFGSDGCLTVQAPPECCWTAVSSNPSELSFSGTSSGCGGGRVCYDLSPFWGDSLTRLEMRIGGKVSVLEGHHPQVFATETPAPTPTPTTTGTVTGQLSAPINATQGTIPLLNVVAFPASGIIQIDDELLSYVGMTAGDLIHTGRGLRGTAAADHGEGAQVSFVAPLCTGDCSGDGRVTVNELVLGVGIALNRTPLTQCVVFDGGADGKVAVNELVQAVAFALSGCP